MLRVRQIIVCGHYSCGGVRAALLSERLGLSENWLRHVQDVRWQHQAELDALPSQREQLDRLCELNVMEQVVNVSRTTIVRDAWAHGQTLAVHGVVYDVADGLLRDLGMGVTGEQDRPVSVQEAIR